MSAVRVKNREGNLYISHTSGNCDAKERAIECYKQGIDELKKGIEIECDEQGMVNEWLWLMKAQLVLNLTIALVCVYLYVCLFQNLDNWTSDYPDFWKN